MPYPMHPAQAAQPPAALPAAPRRGLWAVPMVLSVLFAIGVVLWAEQRERGEREEQRRSLLADTLSLEAQLRSRIDLEYAHLRTLATQLGRLPRQQEALTGLPGVAAGFRRLWLSVVWLDEHNRILADVHEDQPPRTAAADEDEWEGLSSHLVVSVGGSAQQGEPERLAALDPAPNERLVVRYSPAVLLKRNTPWWVSNKYIVRLVDTSGHVLAAVDAGEARTPLDGSHLSHRVLVGDGMPDAFLELMLRERTASRLTELPLVLTSGFLLLIAIATWLLRRQMRQVLRAEAAWRTEAAWRGAIEDSALVGLRARDAEGRLLYVNRTFCAMVGLPAEELVGRLPPMPYWPPDQIAEAEQRSRRSLAGLAPREGYEGRWRHRDGHLLDVMVFESPLVDATGHQIGWMGSIIDVTQRKRLEERERHQAEAMAHQARLTTLGEIASALAHQLNQPLTAIASYNGGVLHSLQQAGFEHEPVLRALRRQGEQAQEAGRIVQRIRQFLTRRSPQREPCDLPATLHRAVDLLRRDLQRQHITVEWALAEPLPEVLADPVLIEQVVINLVRNAADEIVAARHATDATGATDPPGGAGRIRISASHAGPRHVRIDMDDNGPGLRGCTIERLTAPFYSTKRDGMGMGLAICRSVIEAHYGAMDACPGPLGGARFSFTLPVCLPDEADSSSSAASMASDPASARTDDTPPSARPAADPSGR